MAFDDRHTEWLVTVGLVSITVGVMVPILQALGYRGWHLGLGLIGCGAAGYLLLVLLVNIVNIVEWVKNKIRQGG